MKLWRRRWQNLCFCRDSVRLRVIAFSPGKRKQSGFAYCPQLSLPEQGCALPQTSSNQMLQVIDG